MIIAGLGYASSQLVGTYIGFRVFRYRQKRDRVKKLEGSHRKNELAAWNQKSLPSTSSQEGKTMWEPSLISALENLLERGRELQKKSEEVADSATPSYWLADESDAYDKAKKAFMSKLDEHIDARIKQMMIFPGEAKGGNVE